MTVIVFVLVAALVYAANSSYVLSQAADEFAPDYNISYKKIEGNLFTGVRVDGVNYNDTQLVQSVRFRWNPSSLLYKKIAVHTLEVESLNVDVLKKLLSSFPADTTDEESEPFNFIVALHHASLSVEPFKESGVFVSKTELEVDGIHYAAERLGIKGFDFTVESNVTDIHLQGSMKREHVSFKNIILKDINVSAIQKIVVDQGASSDKNVTSGKNPEENATNPLIPKRIVVDSLRTELLPVTYEPVKVQTLVLRGKALNLNLEKMVLNSGTIDINGTTNLSRFHHEGKIKENQLVGETVLTPRQALFDLYKLPLRKEAIGKIVIDIKASEDRLEAQIRAKAKHILTTQSADGNQSGEFNVDIDKLLSHVVYDIGKNRLEVKTGVTVSTPYAKDISLNNLFFMDKNISYSGTVNVKELIGVDKNLTRPIHDLAIVYRGSEQNIKADISSEALSGVFSSDDFKKAYLHLQTDKKIKLGEMVELPERLQDTEFNADVNVPLDLETMTPVKADVTLTSNVINLDGALQYDKEIQVKVTTSLPENSLLRSLDKNVKWDSIKTIHWDLLLQENTANLKLNSKILESDVQYGLKDSALTGQLQLGSSIVKIEGKVSDKIKIESHIDSLKRLFKSVESLYSLDGLPPLEGPLDIDVDIVKAKKASLSLRSPKLVYKEEGSEEQLLEDLKITVDLNASQVMLNSYNVVYDKMKLFSTKPSLVEYKDNTIILLPLWVNDKLKTTGKYDLRTQKGSIVTEADRLELTHEIADIRSNIDLQTSLDGNKTSINGKILLLGGKIRYDLDQKTFASDSDIMVLQEMKQKEQSPFMENLSASIQVESEKPLVYKRGDIDIEAKVGLGIHKVEKGELMVLGSVELLKGGSYMFEGKKFVLEKSFVHFTGNPNKPLLEITVKYKSLNHLITIIISGSADAPNVNFSSKPRLTKEQILSIILFDSEGAAGTNSSEDMMKMMGGAMAKSALSNVGLKLDHLVLGEGNSVEVGKKLTNKIMVIYVNDEVSSVKLTYEHGETTESVIGVSQESQSYDIIYKRDFNEKDLESVF